MKPPDSQRIAGLIIPSLLGIFLIGTSSFDLIPEYGVLNGKRVLEVLLLLMIFSATALLPGLRVSFGRLLTNSAPLGRLLIGAGRIGRCALRAQVSTPGLWIA